MTVARLQAPRESRPIEQSCFWLAGRRRPADPPLTGRREADIAIVGAGFTGLWTANFIKALAPDRDVVVLEQGIAAYGASGRNAGVLVEGLHHSHRLAVKHFGPEGARIMARAAQENVEGLVHFLEARAIDCDLERNGQLKVALSPDQFEGLRESEARAREVGETHLRLLDAAAARAEVRSDRYHGALFNPRWGILNPVKLVEGLKRAAVRQEVAVYEQTRVTGFEARRAGMRLRTASGAGGRGAPGEVVARKVVLATNAYTHQIVPWLARRFLPLYDYILVSDPLTPEQRAAIGWRRRQSISDTRTFFKYYRLTADDRILFGTSEAAYYRGNRVDPGCDHSEGHYAELRASFVRHFPVLRDLEFPYAWGGPICSTLRFIPFFGSAHGGRVVYGLGYTGQGVASSHLAGEVLAHRALDRPSPLLDLPLVRKRAFPIPPEPLRGLLVRVVTRALRRVDEGARPGPLLRLLEALGIGLSS